MNQRPWNKGRKDIQMQKIILRLSKSNELHRLHVEIRLIDELREPHCSISFKVSRVKK